jgi:tetratricopeptide (TPR) repeat protein
MDDYCNREDWLAAYLDKTVSGRELIRIEQHLATCSKCLSELIAAKTELDDIAATDPELHRERGLGFISSRATGHAASSAAAADSPNIPRLFRFPILSASISAALALVIGISFLHLIDTREYDPDYKEAMYLLHNIMSVSRIGPLRLSDGRREPPSGTNSLRSGGSLHRNLAVRTEGRLRRSLNRYPGDHAILTALGHLYISTGQPERAEIYYENALLLKPRDPSILNNIAVAAYRRGEPSRALEHLVQAEHLDNPPPETMYNIAVLYGESNKMELQQSYLRLFLELDGTSPWAERARKLIVD